MPTAFLTDVDEAMSALQYILPVSLEAHLALESMPSSTMKFLESPWMHALVVLFEFVAHPSDAALSFDRGQENFSCVAVHDLLCSFFDSVLVCDIASACLPCIAAYVAEFCFADAAG